MDNHAEPAADISTCSFPPQLIELCERIADAGGRGWLVGGCVRDLLSGIPPKDFDLEVFHIEPEPLLALLRQCGHTESVGKHFGVHKLWLDGLEIDVALPRTEQKCASGHSGFNVQSDPHLSPEIATLRRDFTINAMMFDPLKQSLLDLHGGRTDLTAGRLRHVSPAFSEDPLRPLRAMQFAARFKLTLAEETAHLCKPLRDEGRELPDSRIREEWKKWASAPHPSYGLQALADAGWLQLYPELESLVDCPQDSRWHPEGDVWTHTLLCCDQAARIAELNKLSQKERHLLLFATLCHDLGKPGTTCSEAGGSITSAGHSEAGAEPTTRLLQRIATPRRLIEQVLPLVREHITHLHGKPTTRAVRRLAHRLEPANIRLWEMLVEADASGRAPAPPSRPALCWLEVAESLAHDLGKPQAIITGNILIELGHQPGPAMGQLLATAYQAQLDGEFDDKESALAWLNKR